MNHFDEIRQQLSLSTPTQNAWSSLSRKERSVFIKLAGLEPYYSILVSSEFDSFKQNHQTKLTLAIHRAANIALKFKTKMVSLPGIDSQTSRAA